VEIMTQFLEFCNPIRASSLLFSSLLSTLV